MSRKTHFRNRSTALTVALVAACSVAGASGCAEIDDRPATWSYVYTTVIRPNCATSNCHTPPASTAGLRFNSMNSAYTYLTGRLCEPDGNPDIEPDHNFVVPGQPDSSKLMYLLRGEEVRNMPPDVPLPDAEVELIERWILEGAECN